MLHQLQEMDLLHSLISQLPMALFDWHLLQAMKILREYSMPRYEVLMSNRYRV
jgi:hypothetical protein